MNLDELRVDSAIKQKKGLHFIISSVFIWSAIMVIHLTNMPIITKNMLTFFCTAPLVPLAFFVSKMIKVDFQNKENPLTNLGILFSVNQILYLLIPMWLLQAVPDKMLMVVAMIFGAHLLPYGWLYKSKTYMVFAGAIPIFAMILGLNFEPYVLAMVMVLTELLFCLGLLYEIRKMRIQ